MRLVAELDPLSFQVFFFVGDTHEEMKAFLDRYYPEVYSDIKINFPIIPNARSFNAAYGGKIGYPRIFVVDKYGITHNIYIDSDYYDEWKTYKDLRPIIVDLMKL